MTRRGLLSFLFARQPRDIREVQQRLIEFEKHHDPFARKLFGCEATGEFTPENCKTWRQGYDWTEYLKARDKASDLYDLKK